MPKQTAMILVLSMGASVASGQSFDSGSDGSYGPINCTTGTCTLDMPPDGIFRCTTITVGSGATLSFRKNPFNTPVYLLATGDINIVGSGVIDVAGGSYSSNPGGGGIGGPGGFNGGNPGLGTSVPPSDGQGPGGGTAGINGNSDQGAGGGSFGQSPPSGYLTSLDGTQYGNPLCFPFVGGSGGGGSAGNPGLGGGGGGGAILLTSNSRVSIPSGQIYAWGGSGGTGYNSGSGGAVRIVAPTVVGGGTVYVWGSAGAGDQFAGPGRIRIDTTGPVPSIGVQPSRVASVGSFMKVFPTPMPRLDIVHAAGHDIAEDEPEPVLVQLSFGSPATQTVTVQARNFVGILPIRIVAAPEHGSRVVVDTEIDMTNVALGDPGQVSVDVDLPINTPTRIHAWTR